MQEKLLFIKVIYILQGVSIKKKKTKNRLILSLFRSVGITAL